MKKITLLAAVIVAIFTNNCLADVMPIILNCTFTVKGNTLHIDVHNQDGWSRDFDLNENEVTIIKNQINGHIKVSVHKSGTDYWQVGRMYDISLYQATRLAPRVDANMAYVREVSPTETEITVK